MMLWFLFLTVSTSLGWPQTGLTLRGEVAEGAQGADVTLVFRTEGFWEITDGMGTIQWDPLVMDYVTAGDFGIPDLDSGAFTRIPEGMLSFEWSSDDLLGNTVPDGTVLFSLTFGLRGSPGASTTVAFTNGFTPLHFESVENLNLPFTSVPGKVSVVPEPAAALMVLVSGILMVAIRICRGHPRAASEKS